MNKKAIPKTTMSDHSQFSLLIELYLLLKSSSKVRKRKKHKCKLKIFAPMDWKKNSFYARTNEPILAQHLTSQPMARWALAVDQ